LEIERIVAPEIEAILGQEKYAQVNDDLTIGLGISRGILDGKSGMNTAEVNLFVKGLMEEIEYARRLVTKWIYDEYTQIAEAVGFDRFPKVRWDNSVLKDIILYMATISQMVDRRMLSYQTALEELGFDYPNEFNNMEKEFPLVQDGIFGIIGSPWQQKGGFGTQPAQNSPTGTPSSGRPKGQPAKTKQPETNPTPQSKVKQQQQVKKQTKASEGESKFEEIIKGMPEKDFSKYIKELHEIRLANEESEVE
jgi:hypothetical protein